MVQRRLTKSAGRHHDDVRINQCSFVSPLASFKSNTLSCGLTTLLTVYVSTIALGLAMPRRRDPFLSQSGRSVDP
jgi:hypothetical protein